jgi:predicted enzyme related to lactoylglutathione lyase
MAERTTYTPGTFCWTDLTTTDQEAAKAFYTALFGWSTNDFPVGEGAFYSIASLDGKSVAAIAPQPPAQRDAGAPPVWNSYVSVESADAAAARAKELGAAVHADAFDVMEAGRMAVIQDPQGAYFIVWEGKDTIGAELVNAAGAFTWNDLASPDLEGSGRFYSDLFGWTIEPMEGMGDMPYHVIKNSVGGGNGGIRPVMPPGAPPHWAVYFGTDDLGAALARLEQLGGRKLIGPMAVGPGMVAAVQDPQGAAFMLYEGEFEG